MLEIHLVLAAEEDSVEALLEPGLFVFPRSSPVSHNASQKREVHRTGRGSARERAGEGETHHGLLTLDAVRETDTRGAVLPAGDTATRATHDGVCKESVQE